MASGSSNGRSRKRDQNGGIPHDDPPDLDDPTFDVIVYERPKRRRVDDNEYLAHFGEGGIYRWPAVAGGWKLRSPIPAPLLALLDLHELDPEAARLALILSGVIRR